MILCIMGIGYFRYCDCQCPICILTITCAGVRIPKCQKNGVAFGTNQAGVAELADAPDLGSGAARRGSSSLFARTKKI